MIGLGILLAHLIGDYLLQSHWMACEKTKRWWPAIAHGATYTVPHLIVTQSVWALLVIGGTHVVIDRLRLARFVVWAKNLVGPRSSWAPWPRRREATGYPLATPPGLAMGLLFIADNTLHLAINAAAVMWL